MTTSLKQKEFIRSQLRLPPDLHRELMEAAESNGRSLNAEILARLQPNPIQTSLVELKEQNVELKAIARRILDAVTK